MASRGKKIASLLYAAWIAAMIGGCVAGFLEWVNAEPGTNDPWEADSIYLR